MHKHDFVFGISLRLQVYQQLREELAKVKTLEGIVDVNRELKLRCQVPRRAALHTWRELTVYVTELTAVVTSLTLVAYQP